MLTAMDAGQITCATYFSFKWDLKNDFFFAFTIALIKCDFPDLPDP